MSYYLYDDVDYVDDNPTSCTFAMKVDNNLISIYASSEDAKSVPYKIIRDEIEAILRDYEIWERYRR